VRAGRANCWPYYYSTIKAIDQYTWLTTEGVECKNAADVVLKGVDKCKISKEVACNDSKKKRMALKAGEKCMPAF
jgi:hypothetical protein